MSRIALTAGGTGGHLYPAIATAEALRARGHDCLLLTDERGLNYQGRPEALTAHALPSSSPFGGIGAKIRAALKIAHGAKQALALYREHRPAAVVGFGGHAAVPAAAAALFARIPLLLHEQNAVLGRANKLFARRAAKVLSSFAQTEGAPGDATRVGVPVRPDILALHGRDYAPPASGEKLRILITGGSQGAQIFADMLPGALDQLGADARARLSIAHQVRTEDLDRVSAAYEAWPELDSEIAPFFSDMAEQLGRAHLGVMRAGASTCAEICAAGLPAILIPYGYAMDDHQAANALALADAGAAAIATAIPSKRAPDAPRFDAGWLAKDLHARLEDLSRLATMSAAAKGLAVIDAAERLADAVEACVNASHT